MTFKMKPEDTFLRVRQGMAFLKRAACRQFLKKTSRVSFHDNKPWREQIWDQAAALAQCCLVNDSAWSLVMGMMAINEIV